jgi:hypothetical protein
MTTPKTDCEALLSSVLPFAEEMLRRYGEFHPYGGAMRPDGELVSIAGYDGSERPPSTETIKLLKGGFRTAARERQFKATALVYDVKVTLPGDMEKSDAIAVSLNHRDGYSVIVLFPYRIDRSGPILGSPIAQEGEADIFSSS